MTALALTDPLTAGGAAGLALLGAYNAVSGRVTRRAVKPNGESLHDLLAKLVVLDTYQHNRNHRILASQARIEGLLRLGMRDLTHDDKWVTMSDEHLAELLAALQH